MSGVGLIDAVHVQSRSWVFGIMVGWQPDLMALPLHYTTETLSCQVLADVCELKLKSEPLTLQK